MKESKGKLFWSPLPSGQREMTQLCAIRRDWEKGTDWRTWSCDMADFSKALLWENNGHLFNCHWQHHWGLPLGQVQQHKCCALLRWLRPPLTAWPAQRSPAPVPHRFQRLADDRKTYTSHTATESRGVLVLSQQLRLLSPTESRAFPDWCLGFMHRNKRHTARNCWHGSTSWLIQGKFSSQKLQIYLEISVDQFT